MSSEVIGAEIQFKIDKALASLKEIGDAGGAAGKDVARELIKGLKSAEKAAKDAAKATRSAADKTKEFGDRAGRAGQNASKLAGFLGMLSPAAAEAARSVTDLADVGEVGADAFKSFGLSMSVVGPVLVGLAAAAAPVGGALLVMSREANEASARSAFLAEHLHDLDGASRGLASAMLDAAVATGRLSEEQGRLQGIQDAAINAVDDFRTSQAAQRAEAEASFFSNEKWLGRLEVLPDFLTVAVDHYAGFTSAQNEARITLEALDKIEVKHQETITDTAAAQTTAATATARRAVASDRLKASLDALNETMAAETALAAANANAFDASVSALAAQEDAARRGMATAEERLDLDLAAAQTTAASERDKALAVSESTAARETIEQQYAATSTALNEEYFANLDALRAADEAKSTNAAESKADAEAGAVAAAYEQTAQLSADMAGRMADSFGASYDRMRDSVTGLMEWQEASEGHLTASQREALDKRVEQQKKAARAAFNAQKAAALAGAIINTALGITQAIASAPFPFNLPAIAAAGIAGGVEIGTIAAQQPAFHKGGPLDMAPDEMSITARRGEYMLNPTGRQEIGDQRLRDANAGKSGGGGGQVIAVSVYKHTRQVDTWKKDGLLAGDPIARAISKGKLVGHRSR